MGWGQYPLDFGVAPSGMKWVSSDLGLAIQARQGPFRPIMVRSDLL